MDISAVIPLYNSGVRVSLLYKPLTNILSRYGNYEIILIDDSSKDNTIEIITDIAKKDPHIHIVQLEKNKGQLEAIFIGYKFSHGKIVLTLDDDAFEEVNYIPEFIEEIEQGYDIILGWRNKNGYPFVRKIASYLFNLVISFIIGKRIHDIGNPLKAKNRKAVDKLISLSEFTCFLQYYKHYRVIEIRIPYHYSKKFASRYSIIKLIKVAALILKNNIFKQKKYR